MNRINNLEYKKRSKILANRHEVGEQNDKLQLARAARASKQIDKNVSRTEKKIAFCRKAMTDESDDTCSSKYLIIHTDQLGELVKDQICCICKKKSMTVEISAAYGFAKKLTVVCTHCSSTGHEVYTSPRISNSRREPFHINKKIVEAMLFMGLGYAGLQKFCITVNLDILSSTSFNDILQNLSVQFQEYRKKVLEIARAAVRDHYLSLDPSLPIDAILQFFVSYDGTYQKRGFTSLYGIGIVIELLTGLVIDFEILSRTCKQCSLKANAVGGDSVAFQEWYHTHKPDCQKNFDGPSTAMESKGAEIMWKRSEEEYGAQNTSVLSDGDNKTVELLNEQQVYGTDVVVEKEECVNHVSKRLSTGLRNLRKEYSAKGVTLGGRKGGALTDHVIMKLCSFYRNAIVDNAPHVHLMKSAVLAPLSHYSSTDANPTHQLCPAGQKSWCWFNKAAACGLQQQSHEEHPPLINPTVIEKVKPLYDRLSTSQLLGRCVRGGTQNSNECLHHSIWNYCPKERFQSRKKLEMAVICAVSEFNMGCETSTKIKNSILKDKSSDSIIQITRQRDEQRTRISRAIPQASQKRALRKRKSSKKTQESKKKKTDETLYKPGGY